MAIELRQVPLGPSSIAARYATAGPDNIDGYSSTTMDALLGQIATSTPAELTALYHQIDARGLDGLRRLPPGPSAGARGREPALAQRQCRPYFGDMAWDEQVWGFRSP